MVPGAGLEPARPEGQGILSPMRLPISPPGRWDLRVLKWRRGSESNRRTRSCSPLHDHSATAPGKAIEGAFCSQVDVERLGLCFLTVGTGEKLERETRFELATPTLARLCSTN